MVAVSRGSSSSDLAGGDDATSDDAIVSPGSALIEGDDTEADMLFFLYFSAVR
jgi:hypothetical protein